MQVFPQEYRRALAQMAADMKIQEEIERQEAGMILNEFKEDLIEVEEKGRGEEFERPHKVKPARQPSLLDIEELVKDAKKEEKLFEDLLDKTR